MQDLRENNKDVEVMPTLFKRLDSFLDGGFFRKEFIVVGAATGVGKSYIAGQIQFNLATQGFKTSTYSLEISNEMVISRMIGALSNIKPTRVMAGWLDKWEQEERVAAEAKLTAHEDAMLFEDDIYDLEGLKKSIEENKADFVIVDFLQNIEMPGNLDENTQLKRISRDLQKLAKKTDCCILALSQLSNQMAREKVDKIENMEFRGSGAIAHSADLAFIIARGQQTQTTGEVKLYLKKNRRGSAGMLFNLLFRAPGGLIIEENKT